MYKKSTPPFHLNVQFSLVVTTLFLIIFSKFSFSQNSYYYGNIHSHSSYSDGNKDSASNGITLPLDNYNFGKASANFDFLGISEHNHSGAGMSKPNYYKGIVQASAANSDNNFVALYGMEWGVISKGGHVLIYGIDSLIGWEGGDYDIYNSRTNYRTLFKKITQFPGAFACLAHPDWGDYNNLAYTAYDSVADKAIVGMAMRSGPAFSNNITYSNPDYGDYEAYYKLLLANGYHLAPGIDHDNHYLTFGRMCKARTVVFANSLTRSDIMNAYENMHFYASDDWNCKVKFEIAYHPMGSTITKAGNPSLYLNVDDADGESVDSVRIMYGVPGSQLPPQQLNFTNSATVVYTHAIQNLDSYYYYAVITQADGDKIWTAPLWYNRNDLVSVDAKEKNTSIAIYPNPSNGRVTILFNENVDNLKTVKIYNYSGQEVYSEKIDKGIDSKAVDLESFDKGLYTVVVYSENASYKKNIIIQ